MRYHWRSAVITMPSRVSSVLSAVAASGSSTLIDLSSMTDAVSMKMIRRTSMMSTIGVMLIPAMMSPSSSIFVPTGRLLLVRQANPEQHLLVQ